MEVLQLYCFRVIKQLDMFLEDNSRDFTVEKIEIKQAENTFFFFLTVKIRLGMCRIMWDRYEQAIKAQA